MVSLGAFLPASGYRALDGRVLRLDEVDQVGVHIVRAGGFGIEAKPLIEFAEHIPDDGLFVLHGEHPDAEVLGLVFFPELLAGQSQQAQGNFIPEFFMVLLCQLYGFIVKQAGVGHLDGGFQTVFVGALLLDFENVQTLRQQRLPADILRLALTGDFFRILGNHLRAVDNIDNKLIHRFCILSKRKIVLGISPSLHRW